MQHLIDVHDDVNQQQLYAFDKLCGLPEFVKGAALEEKSDIAQLPTTSFADPVRRKFPCHTKAATWLANAYFQQCRPAYRMADRPAIQARIDKFAEHWKIASIVHGFNQNWNKIASTGTSEMSDDMYALVMNDDAGHKVRRMPMPNAISVKMAGEYLYANRHCYTYDMRKSAATRILKKAFEIDERVAKGEKVAGADVPGDLRFSSMTMGFLERAAGCGTTHPAWAAEKIAQRMLMLNETNPLRIKLAELAKAVSGMKQASRDQFIKLAGIIDAVDRETGLAKHYLDGVELPEEIFFNVLAKEAEDIKAAFVTLQNGSVLSLEALASLPLEKISEVLGTEFADAVKDVTGHVDMAKFAEIAPTLPRDEAVLLDRAISALTTKQANFDPSHFTKEEMTKFFKKQGKKVCTTDYQLTVKP